MQFRHSFQSVMNPARMLSGLGAQPNGSSLDTTLFHFGGVPIQLFNDTVFKGNTGCSPNSLATT